MYNTWKLPSFMRKRELRKYDEEDKLFYIYYQGKKVGFYVLDEEKFKNLFILPEYRKLGLATQLLTRLMHKQFLTICTTRRTCAMKRLLVKLGFVNTGREVRGKQSVLQVWQNLM